MQVLGKPPPFVLGLATRRNLFFTDDGEAICVANRKGRVKRPSTKTLAGVLKCRDAGFLDFVSRCLDWDPISRMTPLEAL